MHTDTLVYKKSKHEFSVFLQLQSMPYDLKIGPFLRSVLQT